MFKAVWNVAVLSVLVAACGSRDSLAAKAEAIRLGDELFEKKQYAQAADAYRTAVKNDPRDGRPHLKLANAYRLAGNSRLAAVEAVRAGDLLPDNSEANVLAAAYLLERRRFVDVVDRMSAVLRYDADNVAALILWGNATAHLVNSNWALFNLPNAIRDKYTYHVERRAMRPGTALSEDAAAEQAFRHAVQVAPASFEARLALANFLWAAGRPDEAEPFLRAAADQAPSHIVANHALGAFYLSRHRDADGERYLKNAAATGGSGQRARFALADHYIAARRDNEALAILDAMSGADDAKGEVTLRVAAIEFRGGKRDAAMARVDALLKRYPGSTRAVILKAQFLSATRHWDEALRLARNAVAIEPKSSEARSTLARALFAVGDLHKAFDELSEAFRQDPESAQIPLELTRLSLALGHEESALQYARDAVRKNPDNREVAVSLVKTLVTLRDYAAAERELNLLLRRFPSSPDVLAQLGALHLARGDDEPARAAFGRALQGDHDSLDALSGLIALQLKEQRTAAARQLIEEVLESHRRDPQYLLLAGKVYSADHDVSRAESAFRQALEIDNETDTTALALADFLAGQGRLDEAKGVIDELLARRPESLLAHTSLAMLLEQMGRTAEARTEYEKILARTPHAATASYRLAALYVEQGDNLEVALSLAVDAKQQLPQDPAVSDILGWVYARKNLPDLALPHLRDAVRAAPDNPIYRFHLGSAYLRAGQHARSRDELTRALQIDPTFAQAEQARAALASLRK